MWLVRPHRHCSSDKIIRLHHRKPSDWTMTVCQSLYDISHSRLHLLAAGDALDWTTDLKINTLKSIWKTNRCKLHIRHHCWSWYTCIWWCWHRLWYRTIKLCFIVFKFLTLSSLDFSASFPLPLSFWSAISSPSFSCRKDNSLTLSITMSCSVEIQYNWTRNNWLHFWTHQW